MSTHSKSSIAKNSMPRLRKANCNRRNAVPHRCETMRRLPTLMRMSIPMQTATPSAPPKIGRTFLGNKKLSMVGTSMILAGKRPSHVATVSSQEPKSNMPFSGGRLGGVFMPCNVGHRLHPSCSFGRTKLIAARRFVANLRRLRPWTSLLQCTGSRGEPSSRRCSNRLRSRASRSGKRRSSGPSSAPRRPWAPAWAVPSVAAARIRPARSAPGASLSFASPADIQGL